MTIDTKLEPILSSRITQIVSTVDARPAGAPLPVSNSTNGGTFFVAAVDEQDRILLAAFNQGTTVNLTVDSTAYALARTVLGAPPRGVDENTWERQIRSLTRFPDLVAATNFAIQAGAIPEDDLGIAAVLLSLISSANEITATSAISGFASSTRPLAAAVVATPRIESVPHTALSDSFAGATFSLRLTKALADGSIEVTNSTPLYWAIRSESSDGNKLPFKTTDGTPRVVDGSAIIEGLGYGTARLETVDYWLLKAVGARGQEVVLPGNPTQGFNLVIEQTDESYSLNLMAITEGLVAQLLNVVPVPAGECDKALTEMLLPIDKLQIFARDRNVSSLIGYLADDPIDWVKVGASCPHTGRLYARYLRLYWKHVFALLKAIDALKTAEEALTVVARLRLLEKHSTTQVKLGVCQTNNGSLLGFPLGMAVTSCAKSLSVGPFVDQATGAPIEAPTMIPQAQLTLLITARDSSEKPTLKPSSLSYVNANPDGAKITLDEYGDATVHALRAPGTLISVRDLATDAETFVQIKVESPRVVASETTLGVGQQAQVRLVDSLGQTVFADGAPVVWRSSDETKIALVPIVGTRSSRFVRALSFTSMPVIISAKNGDTGEEYGSVAMSFGGGHWKGVFQTTECSVRPPEPSIGWRWESPCLSSGPLPIWTNSAGGIFYFDDESSDVVFEKQMGSNIRTVLPLGWRSDQQSFAVSIPIGADFFAMSVVPDSFGNRRFLRILDRGSRITTFTVTARSSQEIGGTFTVTSKGGYFLSNVDGTDLFESWRTLPIVGQGTWTAVRVSGPKPTTRLNGNAYCSDVCFGGINCGASVAAGNEPAWTGFTAGTCSY